MKPPEQTLIVGINSVREALLASKRRCYKLIVEQGMGHFVGSQGVTQLPLVLTELRGLMGLYK